MKSKEEIKEAIDNYLSKYEFDTKRIKNKYDHIFRVAENCEKIAISLKDEQNLTSDEIKIAYLIGILHDIGNFELIDKKKSDDKISFDHGDYGFKVLKKGLIRDFISEKEYDKYILPAVKEHNKFSVEKEYTIKQKLYIDIVRDADKLDIFYEFAKGLLSIYERDYDRNFTKEIYDKFVSYQCIDRKYVLNVSDRLLSSMSMLYGLKFKCSYIILKDKKYVDEIFENINIIDDKSKKEYVKLNKIINNYIEEKIKDDNIS